MAFIKFSNVLELLKRKYDIKEFVASIGDVTRYREIINTLRV